MKKTFPIIASMLAVAFVLASCAKPPVAEMEAASAAVAKAAGDAAVVTYAPEALKKAQDLLARMKGESDAKRYTEAKNLALETSKAADDAITQGQNGLNRAKQKSADLMKALDAALSEADAALASAKNTRGVKLDFSGVASELSEVRDSVDAAKVDDRAGNYTDAVRKGEAAQSRIASILSRIAEAVRATSRKK